MTALLDGSVLVALGISTHVHHDRSRTWFASHTGPFATCPITQGTLLRALLRAGLPGAEAVVVLDSFTGHNRHEFWTDDRSYDAEALKGVIGHRQVTDAYLAQLARARSGRVVTLDEGLAVTHSDVVDLVPMPADVD